MIIPKLKSYRHEEHEDIHINAADENVLIGMVEVMPEKVVVLIESEENIRPVLNQLSKSRATTPIYRIAQVCKRGKLLRMMRKMDMKKLDCFYVGGVVNPADPDELQRRVKTSAGMMVRDGICTMSVYTDFYADTTVISMDDGNANNRHLRGKLDRILWLYS